MPAKSLNLSPAIEFETQTLPCAPVGTSASYRFGSFKYSPAVTVTQQPIIQIGFMDPVLGLSEMPSVYDHAVRRRDQHQPGVRASPAPATRPTWVS